MSQAIPKVIVEETDSVQPSTLAALIERNVATDGIQSTAIPRLFLIRSSQPTEPFHVLHEPALCLVAQGRKQMMLGGELYSYSREQCLVVSVDLPVVAQVIEASPETPYLCLRLDLDPGQLSSLMLETGMGAPVHHRPGPNLTVSPVAPDLLDAASRLVRLLETPQDIPILAPLIIREVLYRLLSGEHSAQLRHIALADNRLQSIKRAINWLKLNYAEPFHIGTICMGGTICQAEAVDRRLGDYFTIDVDTTGALVAAYSDTRQGGAVSLPAFLRQTGGPKFAKVKPNGK